MHHDSCVALFAVLVFSEFNCVIDAEEHGNHVADNAQKIYEHGMQFHKIFPLLHRDCVGHGKVREVGRKNRKYVCEKTDESVDDYVMSQKKIFYLHANILSQKENLCLGNPFSQHEVKDRNKLASGGNNFYIVCMVYGYIRVSTDKQTLENQRYEINEFCKTKRLVG